MPANTPSGHDVHDQSDPWFAQNGFQWDASQGIYAPGNKGAGQGGPGNAPGHFDAASGSWVNDGASDVGLGGALNPETWNVLGNYENWRDLTDTMAGGNPFQGVNNYFENTGQLDQWQQYFDSFGGSARPANIGLDTSNADASRGWQQALIQDLQAQAAGDPNSRAQQSLAQNFSGAENQQRALGSAMRGVDGAAGLRAGMRGSGQVAQGQPGAQQMLMLQEQQAAQQQLAQMLSQQRAQDAQGANAYSQNWLANNQTQNDWVNFMNQQGLGTALEQQQQLSELDRGILGTDVSNRDFAQRAAGQGMQALATAIQTGSQASGSNAEAPSYTDSLTGSNPDEWNNYNPYDIRDGDK